MNIWKTFEMFLALPVNIFRKNEIRPILVEHSSGNLRGKIPTSVRKTENGYDLYVYDNKKVYSLLTTVFHKKRITEFENQIGEIHKERALTAGLSRF